MEQEHKKRIGAVREYLAAIGHPIGQVQGQEVLARALGFKNKHVLAAQASTAATPAAALGTPVGVQRVFELDGPPFSYAEMKALGWQFDVVVGAPRDVLNSGEELIAFLSERVTGDPDALENVYYSFASRCYDEDHVALQVRGDVSNPDDYFNVECDARSMRQLYRDILAHEDFELTVDGETRPKRRVYFDTDGLGLLEDIVDSAQDIPAYRQGLVVEFVDVVTQAVAEDGRYFSLGELLRAKPMGTGRWEIPYGNGIALVSFTKTP